MQGFCVCVPARNEADAISVLLEALARQSVSVPVLVALCVNNSDDGTERVARSAARAFGSRIVLICDNVTFAPDLAHAGSARRSAMELGARLVSSDQDLLISTDADCRPPPDWIAANLAVTDRDLIIGGRIVLDEDELLPPAVRAARARYDAYWARVREIEDAVEPMPWDPAPRHGDHTGASLALSRELYRRAGGVPLIATGEDRALVEAAQRAGGRLIHPQAVWTRTSARTVGRAEGGMASDMQKLTVELERGAAPMVPAFAHWQARAEWRRRTRATLEDQSELFALERDLPAMPCDMPLPDPIAR